MVDEIQGFDECFSEASSREGWRTSLLPAEAEARWRTFSEDCTDGYPWDVEDYFNDLCLRSLLASTLPKLESAGHGGAHELRKSITASDEILKKVLVRESFPRFPEIEWWMRRTPIYAARSFCSEFRRSHRVEITPRSKYDDDLDKISRMALRGVSVLSACFIIRDESWYVSLKPGLFVRACHDAFSLTRDERKTVWKWLTGKMSDDELRETLGGL